jgi:hypothetical protein
MPVVAMLQMAMVRMRERWVRREKSCGSKRDHGRENPLSPPTSDAHFATLTVR